MANKSNRRSAGSIKAKAKDLWLVSVFLGRDANGKRRYVAKQIKGKKGAAQEYLNKALCELDAGRFVPPTALTLNKYLDRWLETAARPRVSRRTADGYAALLERYIRGPLGQKRLDALRALDIQEVYGAMQARGLSAQVVRHTHSALRNALKQAVRWAIISLNPAEYVELPKVPDKEGSVLDLDESASFLEAAATMPRGLIFEFALLSGMRPEEYLALQWSDIDFERGAAQVNRALVRHKKEWTFEQPKTKKSRRTVRLPATLLLKLVAHKRQQAECRLKLGSLWQANDLVFCGVKGTPHSIPNLTYRYFRPILEKAVGAIASCPECRREQPLSAEEVSKYLANDWLKCCGQRMLKLPCIRLYDLRHSHATLLLLENEHPKIVSERLGHSSIRLTLDTYSHVLPTMQDGTIHKLERLHYGKKKTAV